MSEYIEMNLYEKLLCITNELDTVAKNLTVGSGKNQYSAVGEADILRAVKPLEEKYGVYSFPLNREIEYQDVIITQKKDYETTKFMMRLKTTYRFVNIDKPTQVVDQVSYGDGVDSLDKAPGKAMTYSDKYSLMKAYKIMTGDDPDQHHSNDTKVQGTSGARITEYQKSKIIKLIQAEKIDLDKLKAYYKVNNLDELNHAQAKQVISKGENK